MNFLTHKTKGFGLIEVIIGIAVSSVLVISFLSLITKTQQVSYASKTKLQANMYLKETIEVMRDLERTDWAEISGAICTPSSPCHPVISGNVWTIASGQESLDGNLFTRSFEIRDVYRDQLTFPNKIVDTGGVLDPKTKKVVAAVNWYNGTNDRTMMLEAYVHDYSP